MATLGDILIRCLNEIDEVGGSERHLLRETIGADAYNALISKAKGENLLHRWLNASPKTKPVATKALALHIARIADRADLVGRIEHEIAEAFEIEKPSKRARRARQSTRSGSVQAIPRDCWATSPGTRTQADT